MLKYNLLFLSLLSSLSASLFAAQQDPLLERCQSLTSLKFDDAKVVKTEYITDQFIPPTELADTLRGAKSNVITNLPQICRVQLTIEPKNNIEVWLPMAWNHRLQAIGGGGFAGFIPFDKLAVAARDGYVAVTTDTGHAGSLMAGNFVLKDAQLQAELITDFAYRSVHEMTVKAKQVIEAFYGQGPSYSYWNGCSTGGRQGLMEAQRFPNDYDGLYIVAPAIQWDKFVPSELWPQVVMLEELGQPIDPVKLTKVREAIIDLVDEQDGIKDGLVNDPSAVVINDAFLQQIGLNDAEIIALRKIWQGPTNQTGQSLWFGLETTAPLDALAGKDPFLIAVDYLKYWIKQDINFDWKTLGYEGFENYFNESVEVFRPIMGTDNADLSQFKKSGGKMIIWHGWDDRLIAPKGTIHYYNHIVKLMGDQRNTDEFVRLYMAPGVDHCNGGSGADTINGFEALVNWVEKHQAPTTLIAQKIEKDQVVLQRPICQYPQQTVYKGDGDTNVPTNFECK